MFELGVPVTAQASGKFWTLEIQDKIDCAVLFFVVLLLSNFYHFTVNLLKEP